MAVGYVLFGDHAEMGAPPAGDEAQVGKDGGDVFLVLVGEIGELDFRIVFVDVFQGTDVEALHHQPVSQALGLEQGNAEVAELLVVGPERSFALTGAGLDFDVVARGRQVLFLGVALGEVDEFRGEGFPLGHLLLGRPAVHRPESHLVLGHTVVGHGVDVFLGILLHDQRAVGPDGVTGVEVTIVRDHHLLVGAYLEVEFQGVHVQVQGIFHGREGVLRHEAGAAAVGLEVHIVVQVQGLAPALSVGGFHRDGGGVGILGRFGREKVAVASGTLVAGNLAGLSLILVQNLPGIVGGNLLDALHEAHVGAVLVPFHGPGRVGHPDVGHHGIAVEGSLVHAQETHLVGVGIVQVVPRPLNFSVAGGDDLVAARGAVLAQVGGPPGAADGRGVVVRDLGVEKLGLHDVRVSGEDIHGIAVQDGEHLRGVFNQLVLLGEGEAGGAVLGHVDVRALGDIGQQTLHEVQGFLRIALVVIVGRLLGVVLAAGLENEVVHADNQVFPQPEGIVVRAEVLLVGLSGSDAVPVLDEVMVADDGIEGDARGGHGLLVLGMHLQLVPSHVAQGDGHGLSLGTVAARHALQVSQGLAHEALQVLFVLYLGVRDAEQGVVVAAVPEFFQFEIKLPGAFQGQEELRHAAAERRHVTGRRDHKDKAGVLVGVEGETALGIGDREVVTVGNQDVFQGRTGRGDVSFDLFCLQGEDCKAQGDNCQKMLSHFKNNLRNEQSYKNFMTLHFKL